MRKFTNIFDLNQNGKVDLWEVFFFLAVGAIAGYAVINFFGLV